MNLADNIKQIRKDNNLSQEALAEKLGVSRQSVSKWESGLAYPEMDKVVQICKLFNLNIDELLNQDIKNHKEESKQSNYFKDIIDFITKIVNLFASLNFKDKCKCLIEQFLIICGILVLATCLGALLDSVLFNILYYAPSEVYMVIRNTFSSIYVIVALVIGVIIWYHVFRTRYLDYYEIVTIKDDEVSDASAKESAKEEKIKEEKTVKEIKREPKIIIRDENNSGYHFFNILFKACLIFVKFGVAFMSLALVFTLVVLGIVLVLAFCFKVNTLFFWGSLITLISCIVINIIFLIFIYNFIFNRKSKAGLMGIILGISILTSGIGIGLFSLDCLKIEYIDSFSDEFVQRQEFTIPMEKGMTIDFGYYPYKDVEFVYNNDNENIKIEVEYAKSGQIDFNKHLYQDDAGRDFISYHLSYYLNDQEIFNFIRKVIEDLNNYKIYTNVNYRVKVYTSKENYEKLQANKLQRDYYVDYEYADDEVFE